VIGVGSSSQWGKIKASLVGEAVNTPLQDKLEVMTGQVRFPRLGSTQLPHRL
jgi:hypothetical protein